MTQPTPSPTDPGQQLLAGDPWHAIDWWHHPHLAYLKGLHDGNRQGYEQAQWELVQALSQCLGGPGCTDYREAVHRHHRIIEQRAARTPA